ncbi:MAG: Rrf2 family transcriptional regulator [Saprospiraceae bacterium]|jgi:Rrf2 family protein|nr:Rrf2 family transcriptional regulator [Saprospiraceae bacterium]
MFSKSCKYAIRAVVHLAIHSSESHKIGVKEVAEALDVPGPFLAKVLQQLSKNGLISSTKGPSGGFYLSERDKSASMRKVVESIDGPDIFTSCLLGLPVCSSANPCPLHDKAVIYREGLMYLLTRQTIKDLSVRIINDELIL